MTAPALWRVEPHVCLICFGRVLSRREWGERRIFRCSSCGVTGKGVAKSICACAAKVGDRDAGIRCVPNPTPSPGCPAEIIAREVT